MGREGEVQELWLYCTDDHSIAPLLREAAWTGKERERRETNGVTTQTRDPAEHQEPSRQSKPEATGGGGALMGAEASSIQGVGAD